MGPVALLDPKELGSMRDSAHSSAQLIEAKSVDPGDPAGEAYPPSTPETCEPPGKRPARWRILIVDDDVDVAWSLAALLEVRGHNVRTACDGKSALQLAASFQPELVSVDLAMPDMDGYEVCRRLRATLSGRRMVIVALTGFGQKSDRRRSRIAGFDIHMLKPIDPTELDRLLAFCRHGRGSSTS